jgi:putative SOS response-associated peptidase YedK
MCARLFLPASPEDLAAFLEIDVSELPALEPRYNIAPTQDVLVVRATPDRGRRASLLRWGLVPHVTRDPKTADRLINARSETAGTRGVFRHLLRERRCVVPAAGFYEWKKIGRVRQPYAIRPQNGLIGLAGLWDAWEGKGHRLETFTILTTEPNEAITKIHDRMPVVLEREQIGAWLDPGRDAGDIARLMRPYPADRLIIEPVSTRVNRADFEDPSCLVPVEVAVPEQGTLF